MKIPLLRSIVVAAAVLVAAVTGRADGAAAAATDAEAKSAVARLDGALRASTSAPDRVAAVGAAATTDHRLVADRLVSLALDEKAPQEVRGAAFAGLRTQKASETSALQRVTRWLAKRSGEDAESFAKGDIGVPVDKRTGDAISKGREYDEAVAAGAARAAWTSSALRFVAAGDAPKDAAKLVRPFLQSAHDELAIAALGAVAAWKCEDSLADVHFLFRMYPRENRWETSAVAHIGGSNSSAKAEWMRYFGHPLKQRPRFEVHAAIRDALRALTGKDVKTPEDLDAILADAKSRR